LSICTTGQTDRQTGEQTRGALYHWILLLLLLHIARK
jgi:hypothetical protein